MGEDLLGTRRPARRPLNRYPLWRYVLIVTVVSLGLIYAAPNLYPPDFALQIAPESPDRRINQSLIDAAVAALEDAGVGVIRGEVTPTGGLIRVETNEDQLRGRNVLDDILNPSNTVRNYVIALNLASTTPAWLESIGGKPMALGLDLSGGIHFLLEVDIDSAIAKRLDDEAKNVKNQLRDARIRYARQDDLVRDQAIRIGFTNAAMRDRAIEQLREDYGPPNYTMDEDVVNGRPGLVIEVDAAYIDEIEDYAITQNIVSLRNRVNELGVSEPEVTQLGSSRIVVNLPGVQDSSEAKRILDKFANLEIRLGELLYGSVRSRCTIREYLQGLKAAGVGSLPGTSAEVLDQDLRDRISPGRITVDQWTEVITTAHELGIPTTSTVMFGHLESDAQIARHIAYLRDIQKRTGGITEFVPLSFVASEAPMYLKGLVEGVRAGPTGIDVVKVHAIARIMLNNWIPNIQASWVKEGSRMSQLLLTAGVNDLGGTLINESISTSAGAQHGQLMRPHQFRQMIRQAGRVPAERYTTYGIKRVFSDDDHELDPLDLVGDNVEELFGSYRLLVQMDTFRFQHPRHEAAKSPPETTVTAGAGNLE